MAPQDTSIVPDSGPTVASRTAMVVGGLVIQAAARMRAEVEEHVRQAVRRRLPRASPSASGGVRVDQQFEPYPNVDFDDETYRGDAYPAYGWARVRGRGRGRPRHRRGCRAQRRVGRRHRQGHPSGHGRGPGRGRHAAGQSATPRSRRSSCVDGRYLNDRLATYLIPTSLDAPRIDSILVEYPYSGAPHGAKGVGELPMDVACRGRRRGNPRCDGRLDPRPAGTPERVMAALTASRRRHCRASRPSAHALVAAPRPDAGTPEKARPIARRTTDPQPLRGPYDDELPASPSTASTVDARCARHAPAARRAARGPRPDRHQGGLRRGRVRRVLGDRRRRRSSTRCLVPVWQVEGASVLTVEGLAARRSARPVCSRRSWSSAARSAASARRGC